MAPKGVLHPSRLCKQACDAISDSATIRRLRLGSRQPVVLNEKCDGASVYTICLQRKRLNEFRNVWIEPLE